MQKWSLAKSIVVPSLQTHLDAIFNQRQTVTGIEYRRIAIADFLTTINEGIYDYMLENLEKVDEDEQFGLTYDNLFYFRKREENCAMYYHLFPELDTRLIEKRKLMCIKNRNDYIELIIEEWRRNEFYQKEENLNKKFSASIQKRSIRGGPAFNVQEQIEMKFVYSTWIYLWSSTFSYIDENEQKFRFNQMIQVLRKLKEPMMNGQKINLNEILR